MARVVLLVSVFSFSFISLSYCFRQRIGECPSVSAKEELDMTQLTGLWIKYARYGSRKTTKVPDCLLVMFDKGRGKKIISYETTIIKKKQKVKEYKLKPASNGIFSKHRGYDESSASVASKKKTVFTILDTDYSCWAVTYECKEEKGILLITSVIKSTLLVRKTQDCLKQQYKKTYENMLKTELGASAGDITWQDVGGCKG